MPAVSSPGRVSTLTSLILHSSSLDFSLTFFDTFHVHLLRFPVTPVRCSRSFFAILLPFLLSRFLSISSIVGVQLLERFLPAVEELYLAQNDLSDLSKPSDLTETLDQILDVAPAGDDYSVFTLCCKH